jgi:ketose-bisphosphate aldolase
MENTHPHPTVAEIFKKAHHLGQVIPAFNIPYLPMMQPVVQAVVDLDAFALIETARLEWVKFESHSPAAVAEEFARWSKPEHVRLHLDHVPVIDEDDQRIDYLPIIQDAIQLGYESVMIDGSRLALTENIRATRAVVEIAHAAGIPVEAELGAVFGHEAGPMPSYAELFESGKGFTDVQEARQFVHETGCDWLSVAIGNVHGAIAAGRKDQKKIEARLNIAHLKQLQAALQIPLVLHGGSGIRVEDMHQAIQSGIVKVNVGTEIRQPYEVTMTATGSVARAQDAVYERTKWILGEYFRIVEI